MAELLLVAKLSDFDDRTLASLAKTLPPSRQRQAESAKNFSSRAEKIVSYALLAYGYRRLIKRKDLPIIEHSENGKPYFADRSASFSISHSKSAVAVLLTDRDLELGVDIEEVRDLRSALVHRFASEKELTDLSTPLDAISLWTKKEAVAKRSGDGLRGDLRMIDTEDAASMQLALKDLALVLSFSPKSLLPSLPPPLFISFSDLSKE